MGAVPNTRCPIHYVQFSQFWSHFCGTMHCLPQRLKIKINVVWSFFEQSGGVRKKFQTTLILVFEVIVQPPKTHFLTFSSETKIMKITHSDILTWYLVHYYAVQHSEFIFSRQIFEIWKCIALTKGKVMFFQAYAWWELNWCKQNMQLIVVYSQIANY